MKKHFIFAVFAFLFAAGSLSAQSGSQEQSEATLTERLADCTCSFVILAAQLKREIDAAPEDERAALQEKAAELMREPGCIKELEAEIKLLPKEEQEAMGEELKPLLKIKCGEAWRELGIPEQD